MSNSIYAIRYLFYKDKAKGMIIFYVQITKAIALSLPYKQHELYDWLALNNEYLRHSFDVICTTALSNLVKDSVHFKYPSEYLSHRRLRGISRLTLHCYSDVLSG